MAEDYFGGPKFSPFIKRALFELLLGDHSDILTVRDEERVVAFYCSVRRSNVWPALFESLTGSPHGIRVVALQDISSALYENEGSVKSLMSSVGTANTWQTPIWNLLTDIPEKHSQEPWRSCYSYTINIFAFVHTINFRNSPQFYSTFMSSLSSLYHFAGYTDESCSLAGVLIHSLVKKLTSQAKKFSGSKDKGLSWINLRHLLHIARWFTFITVYWGKDRLKEKRELEEGKKSQAIEGARSGHRSRKGSIHTKKADPSQDSSSVAGRMENKNFKLEKKFQDMEIKKKKLLAQTKEGVFSGTQVLKRHRVLVDFDSMAYKADSLSHKTDSYAVNKFGVHWNDETGAW